MSYQDFVRAAAGVLAGALLAGGAYAQGKLPEPVTMTDTAPLAASDRSSVGAVILLEEPVLAQREAMMAVQERSPLDTRAMGAGPSKLMREVMEREELKRQKAMDAATRQRTPPK